MYEKFKLSLQLIQSNFLVPADVLGGNNGKPVIGVTTPVEIKVKAVKIGNCVTLKISSFDFTIPTNVSAFLISQTVLPPKYAPTSAKFIDFKTHFSGLIGHVFRDGSIRFSGLKNSPLTAGTYDVHSTMVSYTTELTPDNLDPEYFEKVNNTLVVKKNFPISEGLSNVTSSSVIGGNVFNYGEFYGLNFYNNKIYTATTDNAFDNTQQPIIVFNKVDKNGKKLIPQVNVVEPGYANVVSDIFGVKIIGEPSMSVNPANRKQIAISFDGEHLPVASLRGTNLFLSNDGGKSFFSVDPLVSTNVVSLLPAGSQPLLVGDQGPIFDAFGNLFFDALFAATVPSDPNIITIYNLVVFSSDFGKTWTLIDFTIPPNPRTFGVDYPILGTGPAGKCTKAQATYVVLKQVVSFDEALGFGSTLPVLVTGFKTTGLGKFVGKKVFELQGTENGGFGNISVGPCGEVLVTGLPVNNQLGSLPTGNETFWYSLNKKGYNGDFSKNIKFIGNSNTGYATPYYSPQVDRRTWLHPNATIDLNGRWYIVYNDQPTPHIIQANPNVYLIYSDDRGKSFSTPIQVNNDITQSSFQFIPQLYVDPDTNNLAITWLDSREDELDTSTRLWGTVIPHDKLPFIGKKCNKTFSLSTVCMNL